MVLKRLPLKASVYLFLELQQRLPFTVLKLAKDGNIIVAFLVIVATVLTVYGIETQLMFLLKF